MFHRAIVMAAALMLLCGTSAFAIKPLSLGKWKVTMTSVLPMAPGPKTETTTECINEQNSDPLAVMMEDGPCKVTERSESGDTLKWKMTCSAQGGMSTSGDGEFTSEGDKAHGEMNMQTNMGGQTMTFKTSWKGERVGDCD